MKRLISIAAMSAATTIMWSGAVSAAELNMACAKAGEERFIQVVSPGQVGQACDVRYTRDRGQNISIPYHANNSESFCDEKAAELIQTLMTAGYVCAPTTATIIANIGEPVTAVLPLAAAPQPEPQVVAQAPSQVVAATPTPETTPAVQPAVQATAPVIPQATVTQTAPMVTPTPVTIVQAEPDAAPTGVQSTAPEMPIIAEAPEEEGVLEDKMSVILSEVEPTPSAEQEEAAVRGPAQLTTALTEPVAPTKIRSNAPSSVVGRLVGAAPVEPEPVLVAEIEEPLQTVTPVIKAAVKVAPQSSPKPGPKVDTRKTKNTIRTVEEIIAATLDAQVAAWNEGNLEAFMDTYWHDDDLKFISGVDVTKGWSSTLKNYRERYSNGVGFGRLSLDKTDVQMVTDDVAVITGRFHHTDNEASASGVFTLVMRRFDGLWRIVHDHSAQDPTDIEE